MCIDGQTGMANCTGLRTIVAGLSKVRLDPRLPEHAEDWRLTRAALSPPPLDIIFKGFCSACAEGALGDGSRAGLFQSSVTLGPFNCPIHEQSRTGG